MDPQTHARFLDYRMRHGYFARGDAPMLAPQAFVAADAELTLLEMLPEDQRSDEDEARLNELLVLLFRD